MPWLLETYSIVDDTFVGRGWALSGYGAPDDYVLTVNGVRAKQERGLTSPAILKAYPFFDSSSHSGFTIVHPINKSDKELRISYCNDYTEEPVYVWHDTFVPIHSLERPIPDSDRLERTQGNKSADRFLAYGFTTYRRIEALLETYFQRDISSFKSILDWGCGCGRVTRHLISGAPSSLLVGCDVDHQNMRWCSENLDGAEFRTVETMPPTSFNCGQFDLIIGISVFTHLSESVEKAWAAEIVRLLQPGGVAIMTVHGSSGFARVLEDVRLSEILASGRNDKSRDHRMDEVVQDRNYYRATYHTAAGAARIFNGKLDMIAIVAAANALVQDFLVLRKSSVA